jgi:SAM-dependent methyltransferase
VDRQFWDSKYSVAEFVYTKEVNRFVKEHLANLPPGRAIDLAGGEGRNTVFLAQKGWLVENIDISSVGLEKCQELALERGVSKNVITNNASALDFESELAPVDLGLIGYLQIPQQELEIAITRLVANLKPDGIFFGVWHALENLESGFGGPQDPKLLPSKDSLGEILSGLNLEISFVENRDGQIQTRDGLRPSITLVCLAKKAGFGNS